jgi:hypothetical protein
MKRLTRVDLLFMIRCHAHRGDCCVFLVENERTKLTANWLNALATALVAAGFFAPGAALLYGLSPASLGIAYVLTLAVGCLALGGGIHLMARAMLWRLRE